MNLNRPRCRYEMKTFKALIGIAAILFALMHVVGLLTLLTSETDFDKYSTSKYMGKIAGICIGSIVAIVCFRNKKDTITGIEKQD